MAVVAGEKFELNLLRVSDILLHEECEDNRSEKLVERFNREFVLYNPLIVGKYKGKYILVDGANRFEALKLVGSKLILAQLVKYGSKKVKLKSWYHFVNSLEFDTLCSFIEKSGLTYKKCRNEKLIEKIKNKLNVVGVISKSGEALYIKLNNDFKIMLAELCRLNNFYENTYSYTRIDSDTNLNDLDSLSPENGLLFIYPTFSKTDIIKISGIEQKLPAGITRHLIPNRVLHIKYNIDFLRADKEIDKRNKELQEFIDNKIGIKKVRLYREPILVFDE